MKSMYFQLNLEDTKAFKELEALNQTQEQEGMDAIKPLKRSPVVEALKKYPTAKIYRNEIKRS